MKFESKRLLMQIANIFNLEVHQTDVNNAYLNATLNEPVHCTLPKGLEPPGLEGRVYRLKKALYGLKQAGLEWYKEFTGELARMGFRPFLGDPCVFVRETKTKAKLLLGVGVDDVISMFDKRDMGEWKEIKDTLNSKYGIKDLGECKKVLGMTVDRVREKRELYLGQEGYLQKMINEYLGSEEVRSVMVPGTELKHLTTPPDGREVLLDERGKREYQSMIGALLYAALTTRIDITTAVSHLSRFNARPCQHHLVAVRKVFKYLVGAKKLKLVFKGECPQIRDSTGKIISNTERVKFGDGIEADISLYAYCDATWAEELVECKSTSGFVIMLNGAPMMFKSRKQETVATSSAEAEFAALHECVLELEWFQIMLSEFGLRSANSPPSKVFCDNRPTVQAAPKSLVYGRLKSLAAKYQSIKQKHDLGVIQAEWISGLEQPADGLTKSLLDTKHRQFTSTFMGEC